MIKKAQENCVSKKRWSGKKNQPNNKNNGRDSSKADLRTAYQHNTQYKILEHIQMQPEDTREQLAGGLPFNVVYNLLAC